MDLQLAHAFFEMGYGRESELRVTLMAGNRIQVEKLCTWSYSRFKMLRSCFVAAVWPVPGSIYHA